MVRFRSLKLRKGEVSKIIGVAVGLLVAAVLVPVAITQIVSTSTTGWNQAVATIFTVLLPILAVVAMALYFMPKGRR